MQKQRTGVRISNVMQQSVPYDEKEGKRWPIVLRDFMHAYQRAIQIKTQTRGLHDCRYRTIVVSALLTTVLPVRSLRR
jgi:hypothetical protein